MVNAKELNFSIPKERERAGLLLYLKRANVSKHLSKGSPIIVELISVSIYLCRLIMYAMKNEFL